MFEKKNLPSCERGTALLEAAVVFPFLILMVFATCDLGNALNQYLALNRVVYEGTRYAASLPGLETGEYLSSAGDAQNQNLVRDRVMKLLRDNGFEPATFTKVATKNDDTWVTVSVEKPFVSLFGFFDAMPIRVSATGPYLSLAPEYNPA